MKATWLSFGFLLAALAATPAPGVAVIEAVFKTAEILDSKNWSEGELRLWLQRAPIQAGQAWISLDGMWACKRDVALYL